MELLLAFLSLLSAATGALTGAVRAPEAGLHQAAQIDTIRTDAPRAARAISAVVAQTAAVPAFVPVAPAFAAPALELASSAPLYADRLIE